MLVAFGTADELALHEASEHGSEVCKNQQGKNKKGVRLNLQIGAASYREEQDRRRRGQNSWAATSHNAQQNSNTSSGGDNQVQETEAPTSQEPLEELFPTRPVQRLRAPPRQKIGPVVARSSEVLSTQQQVPATASRSNAPQFEEQGPEPQRRERCQQMTQQQRKQNARTISSAQARNSDVPLVASAQVSSQGGAPPSGGATLLEQALQHIGAAGIDVVESLAPEPYRARNKLFKTNLEAAAGAEDIAEFKQSSNSLRRAVAVCEDQDSTFRAHVRTYAEQVLAVFKRVDEATCTDTAAGLLCELVVLLPDPALRHALHQELLGVQEEAARAHVRSQTGDPTGGGPVGIGGGAFSRRRAAAARRST